MPATGVDHSHKLSATQHRSSVQCISLHTDGYKPMLRRNSDLHDSRQLMTLRLLQEGDIGVSLALEFWPPIFHAISALFNGIRYLFISTVRAETLLTSYVPCDIDAKTLPQDDGESWFTLKSWRRINQPVHNGIMEKAKLIFRKGHFVSTYLIWEEDTSEGIEIDGMIEIDGGFRLNTKWTDINTYSSCDGRGIRLLVLTTYNSIKYGFLLTKECSSTVIKNHDLCFLWSRVHSTNTGHVVIGCDIKGPLITRPYEAHFEQNVSCSVELNGVVLTAMANIEDALFYVHWYVR
eukprot:GHVS01037666.1.p1 GENE.GHVS01037666.1~~GHVS01037666.1.p1  ORF type:complete len:292 (+),score=7.26 GHVS01037666.1:243-1118(+)